MRVEYFGGFFALATTDFLAIKIENPNSKIRVSKDY